MENRGLLQAQKQNMTKKITVIQTYNPFDPKKNRKIEQFDGELSIQKWVDENLEIDKYPIVLTINSKPILRKFWGEYIARDDDIVVFSRLPEGGSKNPFLILLGIAVIVLATVFSGGLSTLALAGYIGLGSGILALGIGGLLGAPQTPSVDQVQSASPSYSITAQGNLARHGKAIPVIYGHHQIYPDFATRPYSEYIDDQQFLYHLLVITQGYCDIDKINIKDTDIADFNEITYEKIEPNADITLFEPNVVTSAEVAGQELIEALDFVGGFIINPSNTQANILAVDISLPRGLHWINNKGNPVDNDVTIIIEARRVDDYGDTISNWSEIGRETITEATRDAVRRTFKYTMSIDARYKVRVARKDDKSEDLRYAEEIRLTGIKAYLTDAIDYSGITMLAVKMRATNNLSNTSSRKINCIVSRKIPVWDEEYGWSEEPEKTSSIAWAIADILRADYGAKMSDDKIDLQGFYDLDRILDNRGDYLNAIFDRKLSIWEALRLSSRVGRCAGILQGGVFSIIRDRLQAIPVAMFTTRNIVKNSFSIKYALASEDTVDGVTVEYIDKRSWKPEEIKTDIDGNLPTKTANVKLFGCTDRDQALKEGKYLARNSYYRRKTINFTTELEGYIPTFGDLVSISHDMPAWGISGDVVGHYHDDLVFEVAVKLSEPIVFEPNKNHYIIFDDGRGGVNGPILTEARPKQTEVILDNYCIDHDNDEYVHLVNCDGDYDDFIRLNHGDKKERTKFAFGVAETYRQLGVVKSIKPRGETKVQLEILAEDERVHYD